MGKSATVQSRRSLHILDGAHREKIILPAHDIRFVTEQEI
jgi:hypothetical protein